MPCVIMSTMNLSALSEHDQSNTDHVNTVMLVLFRVSGLTHSIKVEVLLAWLCSLKPLNVVTHGISRCLLIG
jgi:hypothetical protein